MSESLQGRLPISDANT